MAPPRLVALIRHAMPEDGIVCLDNGLYKARSPSTPLYSMASRMPWTWLHSPRQHCKGRQTGKGIQSHACSCKQGSCSAAPRMQVWFARQYKAYQPNTLLLDNALATMGAGESLVTFSAAGASVCRSRQPMVVLVDVSVSKLTALPPRPHTDLGSWACMIGALDGRAVQRVRLAC